MTPACTAPEVIENCLTRWSDQYSLAASYRVLRGGRMPFAGDAMQQMQGAAAPLLGLLSPATRDSIQRIGLTAEE